ncbi:alkaline phosphatase family protein [Paenibacillus methanolicus]|uniref:Type I phosphodiesterase/nucleotide pyrophosphatase n=1 Tax=Paenibacillus methanolicus TaxID=582686 RepID=A0A5S5BZ70_9BACL|nr:alkaline phosphatase family protein [Paenibacillus methanolicus]TYP72354.1 type I phosphodiesterase/nucleotide pyrophosphatase [Paenibacillus methanolicus]
MGECQRVVIIGWDGAGNFVRQAQTPTLDNIAARGVIGYEAQTVMPTISAQCWGSLLHGVSPEKHGLTNDIAARESFAADSPYPSLFRVIREREPNAKLAAFSSWHPINAGIIEDGLDVHKETAEAEALADEEAARLPETTTAGIQRITRKDKKIALAAASYIRANPDFRLLFVQFDLPDAAGHQEGYDTGHQWRSIESTDEHTGIIEDALEAEGLLENSLLILVSDHGGGGEHPNDHGSGHPMDRSIFWCCAGPGIAAGNRLDERITITDTAAVAARALGLPMPEAWDARVPEGLFWSSIQAIDKLILQAGVNRFVENRKLAANVFMLVRAYNYGRQGRRQPVQ